MKELFSPSNISLFVAVWERLSRLLPSGNARYRRFFERCNTGCVIVNLEGEFIAVNQAFADVLGYTPKELIGHPFMRFVNEKWRQKTIGAMEELREGADISHFRNEYNCAGGVVKTLEWRSVRNGKEIYATALVVEKE